MKYTSVTRAIEVSNFSKKHYLENNSDQIQKTLKIYNTLENSTNSILRIKSYREIFPAIFCLFFADISNSSNKL